MKSEGAKVLTINTQQQFSPDMYYAWFWEGSQLWTLLAGVGMVVIMLAGVMFPLWPVKLRLGVYYLSIGFLVLIGLFFAMAILRLIFYVITMVVASPGIWIFPRLFDDVGFVDSFIPLYAWDVPPKKKSKKSKGSSLNDSKKTKKTALVKEEGNSTAIDGQPGATSRSATIEEVEDDE